MKTFFRKTFFFLGILSLLGTLAMLVLPSDDPNAKFKVKNDYDPSLNYIDERQKLIAHIDSLASEQGIGWEPGPHIALIDKTIRQRFYHGRCKYAFEDNYLANLAGRFIWDDLMMIVIPDDIMKHEMVMCNQGSMLMQEMLDHYDYKYRTVFLKKHMATEVWFDSTWHYLDPDYEPAFPDPTNTPDAATIFADSLQLAQLYGSGPGRSYNQNFEYILTPQTPNYSEPYASLATNLKIFQHLTWWLSWFGWLFFFALWLLFRNRKA